ncbi:MAG TPA: EI24 domain-containing protein, partial [Alphaproteobacteria bacterium]|nr:EI24 domain-containing protein [Alphaproteobacteria bacterium]
AEALDSIGALEIAGTVGAGWLALLLFPAVALAIQGIFLDGVAEAVESRHYPTLPTARDVPLLESVGSAVKLTGLVLLVNFLLLPVYLFLLLIPPTGLLLYYAVNGYLVGREYFEEVGLRRESSVELKATRRRNRAKIWMDGILLTLVFTIPVVNLAGPTLGAAYMVHRYHRIAGNRGHAHV